MRALALFLVPILFAADPIKLPEPVHALSDLAMAAPPEFTADALLRIVESGRVTDRNAARALIEQAFQTSASAKFPVRMQATRDAVTDTEAGSLNAAYALGLDILSLQSRAVRDMLPLDPAKARELFTQIAAPALAPLTCDDAMFYEPDGYYQALGAVVNGAFTAKEKAKDAHLNLLVDVLGQATSPLQLPPLAIVIESASVTAAQRQALWARFNGLTAAMQPDGRSWGATPEKYRPQGHACDAAPKPERYWQSPTAKQLLETGRKLRFVDGRTLSDADRATLQWQQQLADYLDLIAGWTEDSSESNTVFYHEKCQVYTSLLELVPPGPQSDKILADYVDFISNANLYQQSPAEWFMEPNTVLIRSQPIAALHAKVVDAFQRSGNPALVLTVALEKALSHT